MSASKATTPHLATCVLRLRLKDKHASWCLARWREVNFMWNYCNELSFKVTRREGRFMSC